MSVSGAYNFRRVDDRLSTAGRLNEDQLGLLANEGYEAVINLLPDESDYACPGEASIVQAQGLAYAYIPVDFSSPSEQEYRAFEERMQALSGRKVLVHCAANYRVSAFYAIYAHAHLGWSEAEARDFIGSIWNPGDYPPWDAFVTGMLG